MLWIFINPDRPRAFLCNVPIEEAYTVNQAFPNLGQHFIDLTDLFL